MARHPATRSAAVDRGGRDDAAATRYLMFGSFASLAILQVAGPKLSELLSAGQHERARSVYATSTWWGMTLAWPAYLSIIVFSPLLLSLLGTGFQAGRPAFLILGLTMLVATACGPVDIVLLMAGKSAWNLANTALAVGLNIGLNLLPGAALGHRGRRDRVVRGDLVVIFAARRGPVPSAAPSLRLGLPCRRGGGTGQLRGLGPARAKPARADAPGHHRVAGGGHYLVRCRALALPSCRPPPRAHGCRPVTPPAAIRARTGSNDMRGSYG